MKKLGKFAWIDGQLQNNKMWFYGLMEKKYVDLININLYVNF